MRSGLRVTSFEKPLLKPRRRHVLIFAFRNSLLVTRYARFVPHRAKRRNAFLVGPNGVSEVNNRNAYKKPSQLAANSGARAQHFLPRRRHTRNCSLFTVYCSLPYPVLRSPAAIPAMVTINALSRVSSPSCSCSRAISSACRRCRGSV